MSSTLDFAAMMRENKSISLREKLTFVAQLSIPAILANISEMVMDYIDAAMVGSLGASASASIGLVASTTWLFGGLITAAAYGFSVQVAHAVGAGRTEESKHILRQGILTTIVYSFLLCGIGIFLSYHLPAWLGAEQSLWHYAGMYFRVFSLFVPIRMMYRLSESMLQCSGNMKTPSILGVLLCSMDVVFNFFLIFPTRTIAGITVPGAGLGVTGAALGTACSYVFVGIFMVYEAMFKSPILNLRQKGSWKLEADTLNKAVHIAVPMALEQAALTIAQIMSTRIVAPLGTIAIAANSFAVTAEGFCYMPGYGIAAASTTLVGQALGAGRKDIAKDFAWLTTFTGITIMGMAGLCMYFICPFVFAFLTPVPEVQTLGTSILRIELFAEPLFAASIVATGALRGAGDTFIPGVLNLVSIWGVRLTLGYFLTRTIGLAGLWYAMCIELNTRGILFLIRLSRGKWLETFSGRENS